MWDRFKKIKGELTVLAILVLLAAVMGWLLVNWPRMANKETSSEVPAVAETLGKEVFPEPTKAGEGQVEKTAGITVEGTVRVEEERSASPSAVPAGRVQLIINDGSSQERLEVATDNQLTVAELMSRSGLPFSYEDYGGSLGWLITAIKGQKNGGSGNQYWYFYVNGQAAEVGVSSYLVKPGDVVEWRWEREKNQGE